jgi:hypothetical protein
LFASAGAEQARRSVTRVTRSGGDEIKIGALLDPEPVRIGDWLADAAALDAAGADSLWVDLGPEPELDVLALAAALAVMTFRARLVVAPPGGMTDQRTVDTIGRLCQQRLALICDSEQGGVDLFRRVRGEPGTFEGPQMQRWVMVPVPQGRASWQAALAAGEKRGARGLVVPADPRLLDLLRNPQQPGDRRDLQISQG